jgi:TonB family protein
MSFWLLAIGLAGIGQSDQLQADVKAVPLNDPASWVSANDYPPDARKRGDQGRVTFRLSVGADGKPLQCAIVESSGFPSLDAVTCKLLLKRARFYRPTNAAGAVSTGIYEKTINWALASPSLLARPHATYTVRINVDDKGMVQSCEVIDFQVYVMGGQQRGR